MLNGMEGKWKEGSQSKGLCGHRGNDRHWAWEVDVEGSRCISEASLGLGGLEEEKGEQFPRFWPEKAS